VLLCGGNTTAVNFGGPSVRQATNSATPDLSAAIAEPL
jgi:hypothetical protein